MPPKSARSGWDWRKGKRRQDRDDGIELQELFREALTLKPAESTFDMDSPAARERLAAAMWSSNSIVGNSNSANTELASVLEVLLRNTEAVKRMNVSRHCGWMEFSQPCSDVNRRSRCR